MAKARDVPGLRCEDPFANVAARVIRVRADELLEHSRCVLDRDDIERLHDMRVASRRLRAALEVFEPCFPRKRFRATLKEVKAVADALGERRDRDVSITALVRFGEPLTAPHRRGVATLIDRLRGEQDEANRRLAPLVEQRRLAGLRRRIEKLAAAAEREPR
jgi:CHAD domain-containing protein